MRKIRFSIILAGFLLPSLIGLFFSLIRNPNSLFPLGVSLNEFFFAGLFNIIPFIIVAILIKNKLDLKNLPALGMLSAVVIVSAVFISSYYIDLTGNDPSSTGVLIFLFLPIDASLAIPFGYLGGLIVQFFVKRKSRQQDADGAL